MVIFKGERFNHEWSVGEVSDTLYGMSESGWIDQELFFYLLNRFDAVSAYMRKMDHYGLSDFLKISHIR